MQTRGKPIYDGVPNTNFSLQEQMRNSAPLDAEYENAFIEEADFEDGSFEIVPTQNFTPHFELPKQMTSKKTPDLKWTEDLEIKLLDACQEHKVYMRTSITQKINIKL